MFHRIGIYKILKSVVALLVIFILTGCGGTQVVLTTGFDKYEIFVVGTERCTLSELEIYLINIQKTYENVFGEEIWDVTSDGVTFEESIKNTALAQIAQVKTMYLMALDRGLELDEEENQEIASFKDKHEGIISAKSSKVPVWVVPTNEELMIIKDTYKLIKK